MNRLVSIDAHSAARIERLGKELARDGHRDATLLLTLALAWRYAAEDTGRFVCHDVDESAGLAEVYRLDPHSRKVGA